MVINSLPIMLAALSMAFGVLVAWVRAERHYEHKLAQIKLINTAHIEESMRNDGWLIDQMDAFDRDLHDQVYDQDAEDVA